MNMRFTYGLLLTSLFALIVLTGCDRKDTPTEFDFVELSTPNHFLKYPNPYPSLAAGTYTLVAATVATGISDDFVLMISYDDGSSYTFTGSWTNSGGQNALSADNKRFTITLARAGGITATLKSAADNYLYLLQNDTVLFENDNGSGASNAHISLPKSRIDNAAWSTAYYAAIDPLNERDTLSKWQTKNGFNEGHDVHIIFRDTKDLGYGRDMYARRNANGCMAVFVKNFAVNLVDGLPYNTLNLTAVLMRLSSVISTAIVMALSLCSPSFILLKRILKIRLRMKPDLIKLTWIIAALKPCQGPVFYVMVDQPIRY
jgi:hypothetical protein